MFCPVAENEQPHSSKSLKGTTPLFISLGCMGQPSIHIINFLLGSRSRYELLILHMVSELFFFFYLIFIYPGASNLAELV